MNAGQHCWKACWGQPLRSSNLLSSATLTRENNDRRCRQTGVSKPAGLIYWSQFERRAALTPGFALAVLPGHGRHGRAQTESSTPPKRAPYCSVQAGTVHDLGASLLIGAVGYPPTSHRITVSDREVLGERVPSRRYLQPGFGCLRCKRHRSWASARTGYLQRCLRCSCCKGRSCLMFVSILRLARRLPLRASRAR